MQLRTECLCWYQFSVTNSYAHVQHTNTKTALTYSMQERALKKTPKIRREHEKKIKGQNGHNCPILELNFTLPSRKRAIELHKVVPLKNNKQANKQTARYNS